jgi:hypothetical protein
MYYATTFVLLTKTSHRCFYDHSSARWTHTYPPYQPRSCLSYGLCSQMTSTKILSVKVESIAFNIGGSGSASQSADSPVSSSQNPTTPKDKRRRFKAYATPESPSYVFVYYIIYALYLNIVHRPSSINSKSTTGLSQPTSQPAQIDPYVFVFYCFRHIV